LRRAKYLGFALEVSLRLTPSLYFLPRQATADTWTETADRRKTFIPIDTHFLLDTWHANRHEDYWGVAASGFPTLEFAPERWERMAEMGARIEGSVAFRFWALAAGLSRETFGAAGDGAGGGGVCEAVPVPRGAGCERREGGGVDEAKRRDVGGVGVALGVRR